MTFLRNLFRRRAAPDTAPATLPRPEAAPILAPAPTAPPPGPVQAACAAADCITLPLKSITDLFTPELTAALHKQPSEHVQVQIPREWLQAQLAAGAVRITFDQLRAVTPEIFFDGAAVPDGAKVLLPLQHVLRQMTPARRDDQRQPAVPVNIPPVFQKAGAPRPAGGAVRGNTDPWYSQRRPTYESRPEPEPAGKAAAPAAPNGKTAVAPPAAPVIAAAAPPMPEPAPASPALAAPAASDAFVIPFSTVLANLPPEIRHTFNGADAKTASFRIPLDDFEGRMRTGKVAFKWAELREWSSVPLAASVAADTEIDFPLAAVTPLFMAARKAPASPRKQIEVDTRIPDVFSKSKFTSRVHIAADAPVDAGAAPPAPEPAAAAPIAAPPPPPTPATPPPPAPAPTTPAQIVAHLRSLDGVAGVFIATADGLTVASDAPNANENVLAAFAPTVFAQLTKYADMAKLGLPAAIDIHLGGGATIHVRKAGKLYVGVLAVSGRPVPIEQLTRISATLGA